MPPPFHGGRWQALERTTSLVALAAMCGCASAGIAPPPPTEAEVVALETRLANDSSRVEILIALGEAYQLQGRSDDLIQLMERARDLHPDDQRIPLLLGIAYEDAGRLEEAAELYRTYLARGPDAGIRRRLAGRLHVLRRQQLLESVRLAVANEAALATTPAPATVAVFPFLLQTPDSTLEPLGRALAELLVTDLSQTDRLTVLERLRVQALLDEIQLAQDGLVDPATAARSGRLLGAGQIVQGSVAGSQAELQLNAAVVGVATGTPGVQSAQQSTAIGGLFDAEKALALEIYRALGIELTPAERERVNRRPTENVRALLLFGLGLEAEDLGDFAAARRYFSQAGAADPRFQMARDRAADAARAAEANATSTAILWQESSIASDDPLADASAMVPAPGGRDAVAELFGRDSLTGQGSIIRILLREAPLD